MPRVLFSILFLIAPCLVLCEETFEDLFSSNPEQLVNWSKDEDFLIGGLVNPLTGQLCLKQTDLVAKGAQDVALVRHFISQHAPIKQKSKASLSGHLYDGWVYFPQVRLSICTLGKDAAQGRKVKEKTACVVDENGAVILYSIENGKSTLKSKPWGICNGVNFPSGKFDPRNTKITLGGLYVIVFTQEGVERSYKMSYENTLQVHKEYYTCAFYLLEKERLPNGKILKYYYKDRQLVRVESVDPLERYVYASIDLSGSAFTRAANFTTSSGIKASYNHGTQKFLDEDEVKKPVSLLYPLFIQKASSPFYPNEEIKHGECEFTLGKGKKDHTALVEYTGEHHPFKCKWKEVIEPQPITNPFKNNSKEWPSRFCIESLLFPHENDSFDSVCTFEYSPGTLGHKAGTTTVNHWDGSKTIYHISKDLLPLSIEYFDKQRLKKEKVFEWDESQWLKSIELKQESKTVWKRSYEYDGFGNPTVENLEGDLSGNGKRESYVIKRAYSQDGRHLVLKEEYEEGKIVTYTYLPHTNLMTSKAIYNGTQLVSQEAREYDDCYNLIRITQTSGNVKTTTAYLLRNAAPFLHLPEWCEESYEENGVKHLLKRTHLHYDTYGNIAKEEVYDEDGKYCYAISRQYNERGDLLSETNALGHKASYSYDARGHLLTELDFAGNKENRFAYDLKGRRISAYETGLKENKMFRSSYAYDPFDRIVKKKDLYQNETSCLYQPFVEDPIKTISPPVYTPETALSVEDNYTYDVLGNKISHTDANGNLTTYLNTIYGLPKEIFHPDRGKETFTYTKSGRLLTHTDPVGLVTAYTYDRLGRVIKKSYLFQDQPLTEESFVYRGNSLVQTTDKAGYPTHYTYDGAGRKIAEEREGRVTRYAYDTLGRLNLIIEENGPCSRYTHSTYDYLNQLLEETIQDQAGNLLSHVLYTYDPNGNLRSKQKIIDGNEATETFEYDFVNRITSYTDALGHITTTQYFENAKYPLNRLKLLRETKTYPDHTSKVKTFDPYGRLFKKETLNNEDVLVACEEYFYDACGNLCQQHEHVYEGTQHTKIKKTNFSYDPRHRLKSFTRGVGTSETRTTAYTYRSDGKIATKTFPNGITLAYEYDRLGRLKSLASSDGKLLHTFSYDNLGNLLQAADVKENLTIKRELDAFGNILKETFSNGITVAKTYDNFNRPLQLTLPDQSQIRYTYDPLHLKTIERFSSTNQLLYTHQYERYDLAGNLLEETPISNCGKVYYKYDAKGRVQSLESPTLTQYCQYDSVGNLITLTTNKEAASYTYDALDQLCVENLAHFKKEYVFDSTLNRIKQDDAILKYNALDELCQVDKTLYQFDQNGNRIAKDNCKYAYDALNRLVEFHNDDVRIQFQYDPLDRKFSKTSQIGQSQTQNHYLYDGEQDIGTYDAKGELTQLRVLGPSFASPSTISVELNSKLYAVQQDCQGNINTFLNPASGKVVGRHIYTAFGELLAESIIRCPWQYANKRFDSDLNLLDFGKRFYDPQIGRWLTTDPADFIDGMNLYAFLRNNPYRYVDPDGRLVFALPLICGAFGACSITIGLPSAVAIGQALLATAIGAALGVAAYKYSVADLASNSAMHNEGILTEEEEETKEKNDPLLDNNDKLKKEDPRTVPANLEEQMALQEAKANKGKHIICQAKLKIQNIQKRTGKKCSIFMNH